MSQPQRPEQAGWNPIEDAKKGGSVIYLAARTLAAPVEVMLRTKFGSRYFGMPSLLAFLALPMWMLFWQKEDPRPMIGFWFTYLIMQARARAEQVRNFVKGVVRHTRYNGAPMLRWIFRRWSERRIKSTVEPLVVIGAGLLVFAENPPLRSYLVAAGISLALIHQIHEAVERAKAAELHDSLMEQEQLVERFRELQRMRRG